MDRMKLANKIIRYRKERRMPKDWKKIVIIVLIFLSLFPSISLAQNYTCLDENTSYFSTTIIVSSSSIPISYNETCKFECNSQTGRCNPSPYDIGIMDIAIMYGIFAIAVLFFILSWKTETDAFKIYYFFAGLLFLLATLLIMINYINLLNKATSLGFVEDMLWWVLIAYTFSIAILFVLMFADFWKLLKEKKVLK